MNTQKISGFNKPGKCLKTKNGFAVSFHGIIFFVSKMFAYQPWCRTIKEGNLPPQQEYDRLKKIGLEERLLSAREEKLCKQIADELSRNKFWGLSPEEVKTSLTAIKERRNLQPVASLKNLGQHPGFAALRAKFI